MNLSKKVRSKIFKAILNSDNPFFFADQDALIPFLREIWDLRSMPSTDSRFKDAEGDIYQHTVNNNDWDLDYLFIDRLGVLDDNDRFIKFLETFMKPEYQITSDTAFEYFKIINELLKPENATLIVASYEDNLPVFSLTKLENVDHPVDLPRNNLSFYAIPYQGRYVRISIQRFQLPKDAKIPCFVLVADNWDDYDHETTYSLWIYDKEGRVLIGGVKIGSKNNQKTSSVIPDKFTALDDSFCSLGQSFEYYVELKKKLGNQFRSVLFALKDCSFFPDVADKFEQTSVFKKSLIRNDDAERLYRQAKPILSGGDPNHLYRFTYQFTPKYANDGVDIDFDFNSVEPLPNRIYAIIGKNGTGKTQMMTTLPLQISKGEDQFFAPKTPMFSKVIAVSYSTFDSFELPKKTSDFNYVYCGLRDDNGELRSRRGQILKFHHTWKRIKELKRLKTWKEILANFLEDDILTMFIKESPQEKEELYFDQKGFKEAESYLSSGQSIILFVISEIVANIRFDSLLLFDEPETHLHPNAITQLMNTIVSLVHEFESYCIIATHSPLLIQELFSKNVFVLERDGNMPSMRRIGMESFGENLSTLTEEVFGNRSIPKHYKQTIDDLVSEYNDYDTILRFMQEGNLPLSLNVRLYLRSKISSV